MPFEYVDVTKSPDGMKAMLKASKGDRRVPVIVDGGKVSVGWNGGG